MYQFAFEKLEVWQDARRLVKEVYAVTQRFPAEEKYGLVSQIRRAVTSVCANIAEGCTRRSYKEQGNFTTIAFGSLIELLNHLILASDLGYISEDQLQQLRDQIQPLSLRLNNLRTTQLNKANQL